MRAVGGQLEASLLARRGAGEATLLVTEQLAFQNALGQRRAIDRQEDAGASRMVVDGLGDHLLAGAALAGDEHRGVACRHRADGLADLEDRRTLSHDLGDVRRQPLGLSDHRHLAGEPVPLQGVVQGGVQLHLVHGLADIVVGAEAHRLDGEIVVADPGDHDHRRSLAALAQLAQQLDAVSVGKLMIEENGVRHGVGERLPGRGEVAVQPGLVAAILQVHGQYLAKNEVVLHYQDISHSDHSDGSMPPSWRMTGGG